MAQRDDKSSTIRPSSVKLRTSLSQPAPSIESKPSTRRLLTLPEPLNPNNYPLSPAELYVQSRTNMLFQSKDRSPTSPVPSTPHDQAMYNWREKKRFELCKKRGGVYFYGTPPPKSPTGLSFTFPPSTQLSSRKSDPPSTKKDNLPDKSKSKRKQSSGA